MCIIDLLSAVYSCIDDGFNVVALVVCSSVRTIICTYIELLCDIKLEDYVMKKLFIWLAVGSGF